MAHGEPYRDSLQEAERKGEEALLWASYNTDNYCKMAIDTAIKRGKGDRDSTMIYLGRVLREFGLERMARLVANTICQGGEDGPFSKESLAWAKTVPVPECSFHGYDLWKEQVLCSDAGRVDIVADILKKEQECRSRHKGQERRAEEKKPEEKRLEEKKPSIRRQLAMPTAPVAAVGEPAARYGREER